MVLLVALVVHYLDLDRPNEHTMLVFTTEVSLALDSTTMVPERRVKFDADPHALRKFRLAVEMDGPLS